MQLPYVPPGGSNGSDSIGRSPLFNSGAENGDYCGFTPRDSGVGPSQTDYCTFTCGATLRVDFVHTPVVTQACFKSDKVVVGHVVNMMQLLAYHQTLEVTGLVDIRALYNNTPRYDVEVISKLQDSVNFTERDKEQGVRLLSFVMKTKTPLSPSFTYTQLSLIHISEPTRPY